MTKRLPRNFDIRKRPDGKWDVWAYLPDPQLGRIQVKSWQIVDVCRSGALAAESAVRLDLEWRTPVQKDATNARNLPVSNLPAGSA